MDSNIMEREKEHRIRKSQVLLTVPNPTIELKIQSSFKRYRNLKSKSQVLRTNRLSKKLLSTGVWNCIMKINIRKLGTCSPSL